MPKNFLQKSLRLLLQQQTNILSAAFIIMATVIFSYFLGFFKQRLLASIFGVTNLLGINDFAVLLPDTIFQLTIAAVLSSAFIPVLSEYISSNREKEGHKMASTVLFVSFSIFLVSSIILFIFAPFFLQFFNRGGQFDFAQMQLMANLMRLYLIAQILFIIGSFFSALLQTYNHFFIPGIAAALYNLGIIIGILFFHGSTGLYSAPIGAILGAFIFIIVQLPLLIKTGFSFSPSASFIKSDGIIKILKLTWPRMASIAVFQVGILFLASFISLLSEPGRMSVAYNFAKTLAFAPVALIGQSVAQAAFPILSRQKDRLDDFKITFITSFNQLLYLILPISVLILVLRVPIVRFVYGADKVDWEATLLIGKILAFFSVSILAQALIALVSRAFYALHDTKTPFIIGGITTGIMIFLGYLFITFYELGVESIAASYSIASFLNLAVSIIFLDKKTGGFKKGMLFLPLLKILVASFFTGFALYIPIKLLDQLVFDTTRTINLLFLTGISGGVGLSLYLFLTWFFDVKEAKTYILIFKKIGNWREILGKSEEPIDGVRFKP